MNLIINISFNPADGGARIDSPQYAAGRIYQVMVPRVQCIMHTAPLGNSKGTKMNSLTGFTLRRRPSPALKGGDQGASQSNNPEQAPSFRTGSVEGFTLIEIVLVIALAAILGAIIVPRIFHAPDKANIAATKANLRLINGAIMMYRLKQGEYPKSLADLIDTKCLRRIPYDEISGSAALSTQLNNQGGWYVEGKLIGYTEHCERGLRWEQYCYQRSSRSLWGHRRVYTYCEYRPTYKTTCTKIPKYDNFIREVKVNLTGSDAEGTPYDKY